MLDAPTAITHLRNAWYVAAWSHEVPAGTLLARTIVGERLVLWRTADGSIAALPLHMDAALTHYRRLYAAAPQAEQPSRPP
jgi:hypothetical protein